jgi:hypothetical protein
VLSRGGSVDADEMLLAFLGRAPTQDAFLEQLGLTTTAKAGNKGSGGSVPAVASAAQPKRTAA